MSTITPNSTVRNKASLLPAISLAVAGLAVVSGTVVAAILSGRPSAAAWMATRWPLINVGISIGLVVLLISVARVHAFLALLFAALACGFMSAFGSLPGEPAMNHLEAAVELTASEFGTLASKVGIVIALASVIGVCLLESGAADRVVRSFLAVFGEKRAGLALLLATYVVSIPIFFETIFMLLVPLARALRRRTGKDYVLYLMAICCAGAITHTMVIPHPGPAALAGKLQIEPGLTVLVGLATGLVPLALGGLFAAWINGRMPLVPAPAGETSGDASALDEPEENLPPLFWSLLPILLPVALIAIASAAKAMGAYCPARLNGWLQFLGNRHVALLFGVFISAGVLMRNRGIGVKEVTEHMRRPLEMAATVILIICAGGAFGSLLKAAHIKDAISASVGHEANLIILAYLVAVTIRLAQGSVTVAMIAAADIVYPMMGAGLPYHPIYIFLAIGYGSLFVSWMNDGGFWVVSRLGGLTEKQTLGTWTALTGVISIAGFLTTWGLSVVFPFARH